MDENADYWETDGPRDFPVYNAPKELISREEVQARWDKTKLKLLEKLR